MARPKCRVRGAVTGRTLRESESQGGPGGPTDTYAANMRRSSVAGPSGRYSYQRTRRRYARPPPQAPSGGAGTAAWPRAADLCGPQITAPRAPPPPPVAARDLPSAGLCSHALTPAAVDCARAGSAPSGLAWSPRRRARREPPPAARAGAGRGALLGFPTRKGL